MGFLKDFEGCIYRCGSQVVLGVQSLQCLACQSSSQTNIDAPANDACYGVMAWSAQTSKQLKTGRKRFFFPANDVMWIKVCWLSAPLTATRASEGKEAVVKQPPSSPGGSLDGHLAEGGAEPHQAAKRCSVLHHQPGLAGKMPVLIALAVSMTNSRVAANFSGEASPS